MATLTPKQICMNYFELIDSTTVKFKNKCVCSTIVIQKKNSGWSDLLAYIRSHHPNYAENCSNNQSTFNSFALRMSDGPSKVTKKGKTFSSWMDWICSTLQPFNFVDDSVNDEDSRLEPVHGTPC